MSLGSTDAHVSIQPFRLLVFQRCTGPVVDDVFPGVLEAQLSLPRWLEQALSVGFVKDGDDSAPAGYRAIGGYFLDLQRSIGTVTSSSVTW